MTMFQSDHILVTRQGSGPDVVLVPGMGASPKVWASTVAALPDFQFHLVQVKGFAGTAPGANATGPVIAPVAREVARYIATQGLDRPAIVGHSMGGVVALMIAARHPGIAGKAMVVDMLPFLGELFCPPGEVASAERVAPIAAGISRDMQAQFPEAHAAQVESAVLAVVHDPAQRRLSIEENIASDRGTAAMAFGELIATDLRPELGAIGIPVTILYVTLTGIPRVLDDAENDAIFRGQYASLRGVRLVRVPDSSHFIMADTPERFRVELAAFLAEDRPPLPRRGEAA